MGQVLCSVRGRHPQDNSAGVCVRVCVCVCHVCAYASIAREPCTPQSKCAHVHPTRVHYSPRCTRTARTHTPGRTRMHCCLPLPPIVSHMNGHSPRSSTPQHAHTHKNTHARARSHTRTCTRTRTLARARTHTQRQTDSYTHPHTRGQTQRHIHTHTLTHTHTHTRTHTHAHRPTS